MELAAPVLPPIIHKARLSCQDDRAHRPLMALITVYREGWGHLERHTQKLKAQRRTSEDKMRVEMKKEADQKSRERERVCVSDTAHSSLLSSCGNISRTALPP